jgi:hypothetical protein
VLANLGDEAGGFFLRLRLSSDFAIDTDAYKREGLRVSILAMSGHGKSNAAADLVEDVLDNHAQVIIIEPIPEWHTLKARYNNVVVIGGPYQDLPLEPAFAHEYVQAALEKGISLVVNVSDIEDDADQIKFVSSFLWNLYRLEQKYRRVLFLVLEEADIWAPQMWDQVSKQSLSRVSLIAKHGRKIGIFPILISQRPADLHKSPLSQCNISLFGKFTSPADLDPKTGLMFLVKKQHLQITEEQIMKLDTGNFVVSDKSGVHTVAVRKRLCPHGADTPLIEPKPFAADLSRALGGLREEIQKAIEAKKAEDSAVKRLEKENEALRRTNKELEAKANIKLSVKEMMAGQDEASQGPQPLSEDVKRRLTFLAEQVVEKNKKIGFLELKEKGYKEQLDRSGKDLKAFDELKGWLRVALNIQNIYDNIHRVEEKIPIANIPQGEGSATIVVTESIPEIRHKIDRPIVETDESNLEGRLLTLVVHGFFDDKKRSNHITQEILRVYAVQTNQGDLSRALGGLVQKRILQRVEASNRGWEYWLFPGAKERIKEAPV